MSESKLHADQQEQTITDLKAQNTAAAKAFTALAQMHKEDEKMHEFIKHKKLFTEFMFWKYGGKVPAELVGFDNE